MKAEAVPPDVKQSPWRPKLCAVCQYNKWPCSLCKSRLGVNVAWAAKYLGFTDWAQSNPSNNRDREYILNAAVKAHNSKGALPVTTQYWMQLAKHVLMQDAAAR